MASLLLLPLSGDTRGWSSDMHYYRVYRLDRSDKITDSRLIEAGSDQDALGLAGREWNDAIEVWDQARLVGEVKANFGTMRSE